MRPRFEIEKKGKEKACARQLLCSTKQDACLMQEVTVSGKGGVE